MIKENKDPYEHGIEKMKHSKQQRIQHHSLWFLWRPLKVKALFKEVGS
jgi:hypothetical protein